MKRDILIFPKFKNIDIIENIRKKYDKLYGIVPPHITIVFPFSDNISNDELYKKLSSLLKNQKSFSVTFKGTSLSNDNYIFLNCIKGFENIIYLHDLIYNNVLPSHLNSKIEYIPHITLGKLTNTNDNLPKLDDDFSSLVDEIVIEIIGENEESIVYNTIKFK